ncbi:growth hormone secretagogue receptor type 1-like [Lytechinus pictus]|uniref:growth hormone secretagogue receptor type 1-like n=1 Tax=Lytechinus pictus TaxID=7653 RepID=UPI0030BA12E9
MDVEQLKKVNMSLMMRESTTQLLGEDDPTPGPWFETHTVTTLATKTLEVSSLSNFEENYDFNVESTTRHEDGDVASVSAGNATFEVPFFVSLLIFGGIGNLMVIAVYTRKKYKSSNAALHILNLAAGDLFLLFIVVGLHISEYYYKTWFILWRTDAQCILHRFARFVGFNLTVFEMMAIAIDRYFAVRFPLKFKIYCSPGKTKLKIIFLWILSLAAAFPVVLNFATKYGIPLFDVNYVGKTPFACRVAPGFPIFYYDFKIIYVSIVLFFIPIVITAIIYVIIVSYVRRNNKKFAKISSARDTHRLRSHWKTARALLAVFTFYAVCYVLLATYTLVQQYSPAAITPTMKNIGLLLPYANSCMNPVVYSVVNRQFRRDFAELFSKCCTCTTLKCSTKNREDTRKSSPTSHDSGTVSSQPTGTTADRCSSVTFDLSHKKSVSPDVLDETKL